MKTLLAIVLLLAVVIVGGGFLLPTTHAVERTATIDATPDAITPYLQNLKQWQDWTVWNKTDNPELDMKYAGAPAGPGAEMAWTEGGGTGSLKIAKLGTNGGIEYDLSMSYGMFGDTTGKGIIELAPKGPSTTITWKDELTSEGIIGRWMGLMTDSMVGGMLETNLENLKVKAEGGGS